MNNKLPTAIAPVVVRRWKRESLREDDDWVVMQQQVRNEYDGNVKDDFISNMSESESMIDSTFYSFFYNVLKDNCKSYKDHNSLCFNLINICIIH